MPGSPAEGDPQLPVVSPDQVTFAGESGYSVLRHIARMSALGEEPQSPVSRRSKGGIRVKVTPETIEVLAGRAVLAEPQE